MRTLGISVIGVTLLLGSALSVSTASAQDKEQIDRGVKLYATHKCGVCHSVAGVGAKKGPLDGVGDKLTEDEIRQWLVDAPGMAAKTKATRKPPMKNVKAPKEDIEALVAYMKSLKKS